MIISRAKVGCLRLIYIVAISLSFYLVVFLFLTHIPILFSSSSEWSNSGLGGGGLWNGGGMKSIKVVFQRRAVSTTTMTYHEYVSKTLVHTLLPSRWILKQPTHIIGHLLLLFFSLNASMALSAADGCIDITTGYVFLVSKWLVGLHVCVLPMVNPWRAGPLRQWTKNKLLRLHSAVARCFSLLSSLSRRTAYLTIRIQR